MSMDMNRLPSSADLALAFSMAKKALEPVHTSAEVDVGKFKYSYATLTDVLESINAACNESGLVFYQSIGGESGTVKVTSILMHKSGATMMSDTIAYDYPKGDPRAMGSAITYLRRYSAIAFWGMAPDKDDDAGAAQGKVPMQSPNVTIAKPPQAIPVATNQTRYSDTTQRFIDACRTLDANSKGKVSTIVAEGKKMSQYTFLLTKLRGVVGKGNEEAVLSAILGRTVSDATPPGFEAMDMVKWLDSDAGRDKTTTALTEIRDSLTEGENDDEPFA